MCVEEIAFGTISKVALRVGTQGDMTQIIPTFPNLIVDLDFHMKTDPGL